MIRASTFACHARRPLIADCHRFTVCPKADALYPIVSAASIAAKVCSAQADWHANIKQTACRVNGIHKCPAIPTKHRTGRSPGTLPSESIHIMPPCRHQPPMGQAILEVGHQARLWQNACPLALLLTVTSHSEEARVPGWGHVVGHDRVSNQPIQNWGTRMLNFSSSSSSW